MFQFPGLPSPLLCVRRGDDGTSAVGFSHSGTPGSVAVCASPGTIAACRALRRLPAPRHPPCALHILPPPPAGAPCDYPCFSMYDMMDVAIGSGGTPLAGRRHSRFVSMSFVSFAFGSERSLKSQMENRFRESSRVRRGDTPRTVPSRYAALKVRGANPGDRVPREGPHRRYGRASRARGTSEYAFRKSLLPKVSP